MLTSEIIKADAALSALTDEQVQAIAALSQNDEAAVIAKKTGEIYGALDNDILEVSGLQKNGTEKTYDYARRVLSELKGSATGLQGEIDKLKAENERLSKAVQGGDGGEALKQAKADLAAITKQYNELNDRFNEAEQKHKGELFSARVDYALQSAASGLKFKSGLPPAVTRVIMQQAADKLKAMSPEEIDGGDGGKVLVFKGEDGAILRNPGNRLEPYTAAELLAKELDAMGVLDKGRKQVGTGTQPQQHAQAGTIDVAAAKTRVEAEQAIRAALLARGLVVGSAAFQEEMTKAWRENNISKLPER